MRWVSPPDWAGSPRQDDFDLCLYERNYPGEAGWPRNNSW